MNIYVRTTKSQLAVQQYTLVLKNSLKTILIHMYKYYVYVHVLCTSLLSLHREEIYLMYITSSSNLSEVITHIYVDYNDVV